MREVCDPRAEFPLWDKECCWSGLVSSVPNKAGIGIFSPPLDEVGNSIAGLSLLEDVSKEYRWDIFS